jgi:transcriptional regulator with XRE-family HTH domain
MYSVIEQHTQFWCTVQTEAFGGIDTVTDPTSERSAEKGVGEAIRLLREQQRMSVRTLAANVGFSPSFISQVENGQASPSISSLERIAHSLGVTLGEFFNTLEPRESPVTRASERRQLASGWSKANIESLGPGTPGSAMEAILVTLSPGGTSGKHEAEQNHDEFMYILEGRVILSLAGEQLELLPGDSVTIRAGRGRKLENNGEQPAVVMIVSARNSR